MKTMDEPKIEIIETEDVETDGDDCQYCAGRRIC